MTNPNVLLGVTLVDELVRCGVTEFCLAPGSRSAPLALALERDDRVRLHVVIDERSAAFLGLGLARGSRRPTAVVCTSGTAVANLMPAIVEAAMDRVPLLALTADRPPELRSTAANQTIDQIKIFGHHVRWFFDIGAPHDDAIPYWRSVAARAVAEATASPPGPVHLNVALRDPLVAGPGESWPRPEGRAGGRPWTTVLRGRARPDDDEVAALARRLFGIERGVIVAGACDIDPEPVLALAEALGWPLLAEPSSGVRRGPFAISTYEALLRDESVAAGRRPRCVLRIGKIGLSRALARWLADPALEQVLVDADGAHLDPQRNIATVIVSDPSEFAARIAAAEEARPPSPWIEGWFALEASARRALDGLLDARDEPTEPRAARDLAAALPDGSSLVVGSSMPVRDLDSTMAPRSGLRVVGNRGANGIDGFVSTALGIALTTTGPTAALCGDLTLLHDQNGLLRARSGDVDCVFVVLNNDGGGIFSFLEQATHRGPFERVFGTPHGVDLEALARAHKIEHARVTAAPDLARSVNGALARGGVHLLEVRTERAANVELHAELWREVSAAASPSA